MKRIYSFMLAFAIVIGLVGCAESSTSKTEEKEVTLTAENILEYVNIDVKCIYYDEDEGEAEIELEIFPIKSGGFENMHIEIKVMLWGTNYRWSVEKSSAYYNNDGSNSFIVDVVIPADGRFKDFIAIYSDVDAPKPAFASDDIKILDVSGTFIKE